MTDPMRAETLFESTRPQTDRDRPLVTVAVSLYNYADEILDCLNSVTAQTHRPLELIVVDDASTDRSAETARVWLDRHADRFERALLLRQTRNQGLSAARNLAFATARGAYVFVLDADNTIYERAIGRLLESLQHSGCAVAYSQLVWFGEATGLGVSSLWRPEAFVKDNYIDAMALVSKDAWAQVGGYSNIDYGWEDYDFWCKFIEAGFEGVYVPELLCRYRVHRSSMRLNETTAERTRLVHRMMASHPWLQLAG